MRPVDVALLLLFFVSGSAALTYQVCWQRLLFSAFGIDLESITLIVSAFMLGLGCGALVGGYAADRWRNRMLVGFGLVEATIAVFGLFSPFLIAGVADAFVHASRVAIFGVCFLLLLVPTTAMGATLPMLVAHLHRRSGNVGFSIGQLYLANTFGAAVGSVATAFVAFHFLSLNQTIFAAASINALVAVSAFTWLRGDR